MMAADEDIEDKNEKARARKGHSKDPKEKPKSKAIPMGHIYLVMEYVDHDLAGLIDMNFHFPEQIMKALVRQILEGLNYMHERNIVHR